MRSDEGLLDVAIIGAGIGGIACLGYAKKAGLKARAFEKQDGIGGLWRRLPAWQDIQIGTSDWALGPLPLASTYQPDIAANIRAWVDHFGVADDVELGTPVVRATASGGDWTLETPRGIWRAHHLVAASGGHNTPFVPPVQRDNSALVELHSSALKDGAILQGRAVLVVGGGASAFDLLDLCFEHGASRVVWVHRGLKWFLPTRKPKSIAGSIRGFARLQMGGQSPAEQSAALDADMRARYLKAGLQSIIPSRAFDVLEDQLIPGRSRMIENFAAIERHRNCVNSIRGRTVTLDNGLSLEPDLLLWGTGYTVDLTYFSSRALSSITTIRKLRERCGGLMRSLDAPNLYFPGVVLDGIGSATFSYALIARTLAAHIGGQAKLDLVPVTTNVNHFDLVNYLAERDPASFPEGWRERYRSIALDTPDEQSYPLP
jgi:hypothetical protein